MLGAPLPSPTHAWPARHKPQHHFQAGFVPRWHSCRGLWFLNLVYTLTPLPPLQHQLLARSLQAAIDASQVLVLTGETGCGKTTQVPQFVAEEANAAGKPCYIVCTQPRRLAAISVAQRVADERGTGLGSEVGYNVRLDSKYSAKTHILFVTSGLFLKMLIDNPLLTGITHLIVDEVQWRFDFVSDWQPRSFRACAAPHVVCGVPFPSQIRVCIDSFNPMPCPKTITGARAESALRLHPDPGPRDAQETAGRQGHSHERHDLG